MFRSAYFGNPYRTALADPLTVSRFESLMGAHGAVTVLDQAGEDVTYTPKGLIGRSVGAVVHRDPLGAEGPDGQMIQYPIQIEVSHAAITTVTVGADTVALKKRLGDDDDTTYTVSALLSQDGGMWYLGLQ